MCRASGIVYSGRQQHVGVVVVSGLMLLRLIYTGRAVVWALRAGRSFGVACELVGSARGVVVAVADSNRRSSPPLSVPAVVEMHPD